MRYLRVIVLSSFLLFTSVFLLASGALAQGGGYRTRTGPAVGPVGPRAGAFVRPGRMGGVSRRAFGAPPGVLHPRGLHRFRGFHGPFIHRRFDRLGFFGFPRRFVGFPHRRFDFFFGFPDHRFFFGFPDSRLFFFGFPDSRFFFGFPDRRFFFGFPDNRLFFGFPHKPFVFGFPRRHAGFADGFGFPIGIPFFWDLPILDPVVAGRDTFPANRGPDAGTSAATLGADALSAGEIRPAVDPRIAIAGPAGAGDSLVVERVSVVDALTRNGLRLRWEQAGQEAAEVTLFLADTARSVLAAQSVRAPPYAAVFEPSPATAFAGMTVVWPDGSTATRVVAYRAEMR